MPFEYSRLSIPDVVLIKSRSFADNRGSFRELYKELEFAAAGVPLPFVQDNHSRSARGVIRGLHYQALPHAQGKLVCVIAGAILDVAVDIRHGSPWYGQHVQQTLSAENSALLYVPPGFAHGFLVLSDTVDVHYKCSAEFVAGAARTLSWNDPDLAIPWPITDPILSPDDAQPRFLRDAGHDFVYEA